MKILTYLSDALLGGLGMVGCVALLAFGLVQICLGYLGIEHHLGVGWAVGALFVTFFLRITIFLTIGCYFGIVDVIGWPWWAGVLVAAPGIVFAVPTVVGGVTGDILKTLRSRRNL